jgi:hypothetical protein
MGIPEPMTHTRVRIIGADAAAIRQLRAIAPARVDVVDEPVAEPDWILVATDGQRIESIRASGLPPFRVVEVPAISGSLDEPEVDALRRVLVKIAGIGVWRPEPSPVGVRFARLLVRQLTRARG